MPSRLVAGETISAEMGSPLAQMLFAGRNLALANLKKCTPLWAETAERYECEECMFVSPLERPAHRESCKTGHMLALIAQITAAATPQPISEQKEEAQAEEPTRVQAGKPVGETRMERRRLLKSLGDVTGDHREPWSVHSCKGFGEDRLNVNLNDASGAALLPTLSVSELRTAPKYPLDRIAACVNFCMGIPTERFRIELPLASTLRKCWYEVKNLREALPWLPLLTPEDEDGTDCTARSACEHTRRRARND